MLSSLETTARVDPTLPWSLPSSGFLQARLPVVSVFPTARPFVVLRASPLCACHVGVWGGHMSATYTAMPVTGCPPIESPALLLRPASRDCHEICRYSPIKPYVSEYRKLAAFRTLTLLSTERDWLREVDTYPTHAHTGRGGLLCLRA